MNRTYLYSIIVVLLFSSCNTYKTFYGSTYTSAPTIKHEPIYRLDLSDSGEDAFQGIKQLDELRSLNLGNNKSIDLDAILKKIPNPNVLQVLNLDSLGLKQLPESVTRFTNLKQLSIAGNPDLDFKSAISLVSRLELEFLNLKGNHLERLPQNITKLTTLKDINLSYNHLIDGNSYKYLSEIESLYSVWLDNNALGKLPEEIGFLDQIRYLYLDANNLKALPETIKQMSKLFVLHLGFNRFQELPEIFSEMDNVLLLHINNNEIRCIPRAFSKDDYALLGLILDHNPLPRSEVVFAKKTFSNFFILSFNQKTE